MVDEYPSIAKYRSATENFLKHIEETKGWAERTGRLCYLCDVKGEFYITYIHVAQWLYRAYPGGRREFSNDGAILARSLGIIE